MVYEEITTQQITYTLKDIVEWVKIFGARQLNITTNDITDEMISVNPEALKDIAVTVTHIKKTSNIKETEI